MTTIADPFEVVYRDLFEASRFNSGSLSIVLGEPSDNWRGQAGVSATG